MKVLYQAVEDNQCELEAIFYSCFPANMKQVREEIC